jgi:hypothetical protein
MPAAEIKTCLVAASVGESSFPPDTLLHLRFHDVQPLGSDGAVAKIQKDKQAACSSSK